MASAKNFFSEKDKQQIVAAIKTAELNTSGEIRLYVENSCKQEPLARAGELFQKLGMTKTELRNGVLFYLAVKDHKFALAGDEGINKVVPIGFWDETRDLMGSHFKRGAFAKGLAEGIILAGQQLKKHFPYNPDDVNELPDEIKFSDD